LQVKKKKKTKSNAIMATCQLSGIQEPPLQLHHERDILPYKNKKKRERERETNKKPDQVQPPFMYYMTL
jgi:hypothetical protein